jgi:hypothetical protein
MSVARFAKSLKEGRRPSGNVQGGFEYGCRVETVCSWIAWRHRPGGFHILIPWQRMRRVDDTTQAVIRDEGLAGSWR